MKSALKRIVRNSSTATTVNEIKIEEEKEELFLVKSSKHQKNHSRYQQTGSKHKIAEQRGTNPFDRNGRRKKCAICGSVFHWAEDCSHKRQKQEENEEKCNLALFTKEHEPENEILLRLFLDVQSLIQHVPRLYVEKDSMKNMLISWSRRKRSKSRLMQVLRLSDLVMVQRSRPT